MKGIIIHALNEKGQGALKKHLQDKRKEKAKDRFLYNQTFKEIVDEGDEGVVSLRILAKHRYFVPEAMKPIAYDMMTVNGALSGRDFEIKIIEGEE